MVLGIYCFLVVPAIARWFFTGLGQERTLRYILVFVSLTSSAVVAEFMFVWPTIHLALGFVVALVDAGLTVPPTTEHRPGRHDHPEDLETWVTAISRPGDLVVLPIHDVGIAPAAIRVHESGRSIVAVSQNPESESGSIVSPMNLPVGRSLGA